MAIIKLTKGFETIVDDDLYDELVEYRWYASGIEGRPARRLRLGPRKIIFLYHQVLHVLPWVLYINDMSVDHINRDPLDNRRANLRVVTNLENMRHKESYGKRKGVAFDRTHQKYKAYIDREDLPRVNVGTFLTQAKAQAALDQAKKELGLENN